MKKISRREFLKLSALGAAGLLLEEMLASCGVSALPATEAKPLPQTPSASLGPTNTPAADTAPTSAADSTPSSTPFVRPDVVVVRGGEPETMVRRALEALGGMASFVPKGANVIIKPNICVSHRTFEYAATTNPWVIGALVKLCLEAGAGSVRVMDYPFSGSAEEAYTRSGIREQVEAAGGKMEVMSRLKYAPAAIPSGVRMKAAKPYSDALEADVLINVPIAKQHGNTRLTLGLKNLMGLVPDGDRGAMHSIGIHQCIADLASLFQPKVKLTVVDAVRILTAGGPQGGNLEAVQKLDTIIASPDMVAADSYATTLFGLTPADIGYITAAANLGLGRSDLENLKIEEIAV